MGSSWVKVLIGVRRTHPAPQAAAVLYFSCPVFERAVVIDLSARCEFSRGLRGGDIEIAADLAGQELVDLAMSGHRRRLTGGPVHVDGVASPFAQQRAAVGFEMAKEVKPLQAAEMRSGSRSTS